MIDFSKYTLQEQQAMNDVLHDLVTYLEEHYTIWEYLRWMRTKSDNQLAIGIEQQAHDAAKSSCDFPELTVFVVPRKPIKIESQDLKKFIDLYNATAGDPPAPPDMFGWVGDALDDLCAAGEATGND